MSSSPTQPIAPKRSEGAIGCEGLLDIVEGPLKQYGARLESCYYYYYYFYLDNINLDQLVQQQRPHNTSLVGRSAPDAFDAITI